MLQSALADRISKYCITLEVYGDRLLWHFQPLQGHYQNSVLQRPKSLLETFFSREVISALKKTRLPNTPFSPLKHVLCGEWEIIVMVDSQVAGFPEIGNGQLADNGKKLPRMFFLHLMRYLIWNGIFDFCFGYKKYKERTCDHHGNGGDR